MFSFKFAQNEKIGMKDLTRAEEQVMRILWKLDKAFVKEIIAEFPDPKPAYNTVSTIVRILEEKGFVAHKAYGKSHQYFSAVRKDEYQKYAADSLMNKYFDSSHKKLISFFVKEKELSVSDLEDILQSIKNDK